MDSNNGNHPGQFPPARTVRSGRGVKQSLQAAALERFAFDAAMSLKRTCTDEQSGKLTMTPQMATAIYRLIGSWDCAADRLRVLRGKGLPAVVKSRAARTPANIEPLEAP